MVWWARRSYAAPGLSSLLDQTERARYQGYRREEDRERFLVGCALAKAAAADLTGASPAEITLDRTCPQCGKPHGKTSAEGAELSVSHSGDWIAVAATTSTPVGVDVEQVRETRDTDALARYVLSDAERDAVHADGFFTMWARKEAVTKATGDGVRVPFREVVVSAPDAAPRVLAWPYPEPPESVTLFDLDPGPGYKAALAVLGRCDQVVQQDAAGVLGALAR